MGLYKKLPSPYWYASFKLPGRKQFRWPTKVPIMLEGRKSKANEKLALDEYHRVRAEHLANKHLNIPKKILLKDLTELWLTTKSPEDCNVENYRSTLKAPLEYFRDRFAAEIQRQDWEQYRAQRRKEVSGSTVNKEMAYVGAIYKKGVEWKRVITHPVERMEKFNEKECRRNRFLSDTEKVTLLSKMTLPLLDRIVRFALMTGMRRGEILSLKWTSVDLGRGILTVEESKGGSKRWLAINDQINGFLLAMPRYCEFVFEHEGQRVKERTISQAFKRHVDRVELLDVHFHDLRHTYASDLLAQKRSLSEVQYLLGHASPVMTQRYAHLSDEMKRDAMHALKPLPIYPDLIPWQRHDSVVEVKVIENQASAVSSVG